VPVGDPAVPAVPAVPDAGLGQQVVLPGVAFSRSNSLRRLTGSTTSIRASRALAEWSSRPATDPKNPVLTSVRIEAAIGSKVV
jgi:hypothetical protein